MRYLPGLAVVLASTVLVVAETDSYTDETDDMLQLTLEEHTQLMELILQNRHNWPDPLGLNRYLNASHEVSFGVNELFDSSKTCLKPEDYPHLQTFALVDVLPLDGRLFNERARRLLVAHGFRKPKGFLRYTGRNLARDLMDLQHYHITQAQSLQTAIAPFLNAR